MWDNDTISVAGLMVQWNAVENGLGSLDTPIPSTMERQRLMEFVLEQCKNSPETFLLAARLLDLLSATLAGNRDPILTCLCAISLSKKFLETRVKPKAMHSLRCNLGLLLNSNNDRHS